MRLKIPPPVQGLIFGFLIWGVDRLAPGVGAKFPGQAAFSIVPAVSGIVLEVMAISNFFRRKTTVNPLAPQKASALVTDGIYRISRNPMYLGLLLVLTGWSIWLGNILALPLLAIFVAYITWSQIAPEEKILREKFGEDYAAYCRQVRRWV